MSGRTQCYRCKRYGHYSDNCPDNNSHNNTFCYNCKKPGHYSNKCPVPKKIPTCYNCKQTGHYSDKCPNKDKDNNSTNNNNKNNSDNKINSSSNNNNNNNNDDDNKDRAGICTICLDNKSNMMFIPCNHVCICESCRVINNKCPICNTVYTSQVKIYLT